MQITRGKIKNTQSGKELAFAANPSQYELIRGFEFQVEPQLGQSTPLVAFQSGGATTLKFQLALDHDLDGKESVPAARAFLEDLEKVEEKTASVPPVEFQMGDFKFRGYVRQYRWTALRFDTKAQPVAVRVDWDLVSDGNQKGSGA